MRTRAKICGLSRPEDIRAVASAGADAIGLVFYEPSPRNVSIEQACELLQHISPFITVTGLFVNADAEQVRRVLSQVPLDLLQFHGDEPEAFCRRFDRPYIKAIRVNAQTDISALAEHYHSARGLLLDTYVSGKPGGTGEVFDWGLIPSSLPLPVILAGGLNAANVAAAIRQVKPYAVDVSGGVEESKGIKSPAMIKEFMQEVQAVGKAEG
ncbi:MAG: phosphoribosylanthranilate isomerase [Gammaproteobacteria bacterium]|nr:phosphoribosylanthranilate isomerase [Gammaproteobacteria bacterium]MDH5650806.1 phosphoribosylanthranilate isomerase [Gammaproteobacteria bacterium]